MDLVCRFVAGGARPHHCQHRNGTATVNSTTASIRWRDLSLLLAAAALLAGVLGWRAWHSPGATAAAPPPPTSGEPEALASAHTEDPAAWKSLGEARYAAQAYAEAVTAYEKAASLAPQDASAWSALGEARVMASPREPMPPAALAAFQRATALDAKDPRARYFLAVARDLRGDHAGAIQDWLALLADTPPGASWESDLKRTIQQVGTINHIDVRARLAAVRQPAPAQPASLPGPSADQLQAASAIPPSQQQDMARGMVARLEQRLKANPANLDGWVMLMRSRMTLGEPDKAAAALRDAIAANPAEAEELRRQAGLLGIK